MTKNLCIIPARGGSKRIPRKNIKEFLGKPIIAYSIGVALKSELFEDVIVSTDDQEIAEIAVQFGASVPFLRSKKNADDFATTVDAIFEVVSEYKKLGKSFDNICCIYPTAPFVSSLKLKEAYKLLVNENFDAVVPVMSFSFPIQRALKFLDGSLVYCCPEYESSRSQDLEKRYHDTGQFYFLNLPSLEENKSLIPSNTGAIIVSEMEAQDIDEEDDWKIAELKYELLQGIK